MQHSSSCNEMASLSSIQVLIVGGGIGGLTLAAICQKLGISCLVLERTLKLTPQGAGISLAPNALKALDQLGLYGEICKHGQKLDKILIHRNETKWRELDYTWYFWGQWALLHRLLTHSQREFLIRLSGLLG